jgi:hypothetical protein
MPRCCADEDTVCVVGTAASGAAYTGRGATGCEIVVAGVIAAIEGLLAAIVG